MANLPLITLWIDGNAVEILDIDPDHDALVYDPGGHRVPVYERDWRRYLPILSKLWEMAGGEIDDREVAYPRWFYQPATEAQTDHLERCQVRVLGGTLMRGMASDLIGLFNMHIETHRTTNAPNETLGRYLARETAAIEAGLPSLYEGALDEFLPLRTLETF